MLPGWGTTLPRIGNATAGGVPFLERERPPRGEPGEGPGRPSGFEYKAAGGTEPTDLVHPLGSTGTPVHCALPTGSGGPLRLPSRCTPLPLHAAPVGPSPRAERTPEVPPVIRRIKDLHAGTWAGAGPHPGMASGLGGLLRSPGAVDRADGGRSRGPNSILATRHRKAPRAAGPQRSGSAAPQVQRETPRGFYTRGVRYGKRLDSD